jgi:hypothetical protein
MTGFLSPNHTQTPNELFDIYLSQMGEAELKVTLVIIRKTLGYHKKRDPISFTQLQKETGLTRQSAWDGVQAAIERGLVEIVGTGKRGVNIYALVMDNDYSGKQNSEDNERSTNQNRTVLPTRTTKESIQKKEKITSQESDGQSSAPKIPKEQLDTEYDTVSLVWKTQASGFIVNVQGMLFGTKKVKGDWNKCKMNPVATVQEVIAFADYAQGRMTRHRLDAIPTAPDTIQRWFCDFRMEREKNDRHKSQSQNNGYNSMAMNAAMFAEGRES